jgi:hypothetical protein
VKHIRFITVMLAGLTAAVLTFGAASPAAFAMVVPPPGDSGVPTQIHTIVTGGMPGWQISLIAVGAALLAAAIAVLFDRIWMAQRRQLTGVS